MQARVIRELRARDYNLIVDDDGKGEAADVVAIRLQGDIGTPSRIDIEFYHCKYSHGPMPGQRIEDLYGFVDRPRRAFLGCPRRKNAWTSLRTF